MSSLTDIIFLLLIFFMLTSTLVRLQPIDLPTSDSKTVAPESVVVTIRADGTHSVDNSEVAPARVQTALQQVLAKNKGNRENFTVTIAAEVGTPFDNVVAVMEAAARLRMKAIIDTQPRAK